MAASLAELSKPETAVPPKVPASAAASADAALALTAVRKTFGEAIAVERMDLS